MAVHGVAWTEFLFCLVIISPLAQKHGICHGRTEIVCVKFEIPEVNLGSQYTLLALNSVLFVIKNFFLSNLFTYGQKIT